MSTNSSISIRTKSGGKTIYCHWDGYPDYNGRILLKHYNSEEKVNELINLGNISILGEMIGVKTNFDGFDSQNNRQCLAYGRDRGETGQEATTFSSYNNPKEIHKWNYLFKDGAWYVSDYKGKRYTLLTEDWINKHQY